MVLMFCCSIMNKDVCFINPTALFNGVSPENTPVEVCRRRFANHYNGDSRSIAHQTTKENAWRQARRDIKPSYAEDSVAEAMTPYRAQPGVRSLMTPAGELICPQRKRHSV